MRRGAACLAAALLAACTPPPAEGPLRDDGTLPASQRGGKWVYEMAAYAPDRSAVAVVGMSPDDRAALGIARHAKVRVVTKPDIDVMDAVWLDAGHLLVAFTSFDEDRILEDRPQRFAVLDTDGRVVREIPFSARLVHVEPVGMDVSADRKRLLTSMRPLGEPGTPGDLVEVDLETGNVRVLTATPDRAEWSPAYLPDGRIVAVSHVVAPTEIAPALAVLDPRTGTQSPVDPGARSVEHVAVVGTRLVYTAAPGGPGAGEVGVFAFDLVTRVHVRVTDELYRNPTAAPGGTEVLGVGPPDGFDPAPVQAVRLP